MIDLHSHSISDLPSRRPCCILGNGRWPAGRSANDLILSRAISFSPFWGSVSDRIGRRPVLMIGLVGNTVFFTMFGLNNTLFIALAATFMAGVFNGNLAVARAYIGDVSTPSQLNTRMGLIGAAFGLGFTIGPLLVGNYQSSRKMGCICWDYI